MTTPKYMRLTGKILYAVPFIVFGINHLIKAEMLKGIVPSYIPGGVIWVYITGIVFIGSALGILTGKYAKKSSWALAIQLALMIVLVQLPMALKGNYGNFLKDISLVGGALLVGALFCEGAECKGGSCTGSGPMAPSQK